MNCRTLIAIVTLAFYFSLMTSCDPDHSRGKSPSDTTKTDTTHTDTTTCPYPDTSNCTGFFGFGNYIPKGKIVFYGNFQPRGQGIYIIGLDTLGLKPLLTQFDTFQVSGEVQPRTFGILGGYPSFSYSGKKIISQFALGSDAGGSMVYDTSGSHKTFSYAGAEYPRWSPNDSAIAYFTDSPGAFPMVSGISVFLITYPDVVSFFCKDTVIFYSRPLFWTPDRKYLLASGYTKNMPDLYKIDYVQHKIESRVTNNSITEFGIEISKDNKYAAFRQDGLIYVYHLCELSKAHPQGMAIPSGTITGNQVIRFSKDSRFVVFDGKLAGDAESFIYLADLANGGQVKKIIAGQHPDIFVE